MDLLWVRHGEPERIAPGHRRAAPIPRSPRAAASRRSGSPTGSRSSRSTPSCRARMRRARRDRRADRARRTGSRSRSSTGSIEYDSNSDHYIPMEELRGDEGRTLARRWSKAGGRSSARDPTEVFRARVGATRRRDRRALRGPDGSSRSATAASSTSRSGSCSASTGRCGSSRATRRCRGWSRRARGVRSVASLNERAHLEARRESRMTRRRHRARRAASRSSRSTGPHARNAVDRPTAALLADAFRAFDADDDARRSRSSPARAARSARAPTSRRSAKDAATRVTDDGDGPMGPTRMLLSKPVIAAVEGYAVAGGLELALWCDLRVAARDAVFGVFCRRWGVPLVDGGTVRLPRLIGHSHALDLILTGRGVQRRRSAAHGSRQPADRAGRRARRGAHARARARRAPADLPARRPAVVVRAVGASRSTTRCASSCRHAQATLASGESLEGAIRFAQGAGRHGAPAPDARVVESSACLTRPFRHRGERTVADVMTQPVVTAQPAETVAVAAQRMRDRRVGSVVVIDHDDRAIGILTERDMIRLAAAGSDASTAKVSEWMTGDPDTIGPDVEARAAFARLAEHGYRHIPVVDGTAPAEARRHRLDARPHARRDDPARRRAGARGPEGPRRRRRRRHDRRRRARPRRLLPLPPVQRRRPREDAPARRRLVPAVRGPPARDARRARGVRGRHPRRAARSRPRSPTCCPTIARAGDDVRPARRAAHRGLAVRRDARLPAVASTSTTRRCATTRCRRARSCRRSSARSGGCARGSSRSRRTPTSRTPPTTST